MRIALLYNPPPPDAAAEDLDTLVQVEAVDDALRALGHDPRPLPMTLDLAAARETLLRERPDVVFNLVEAIDGHDRLLPLAPLLLETLGLRYTGCSSSAILQTTHKVVAKRLMRVAGLPTPDWLAPGTAATGGCEPGRYILKSVWEHASFGMDDGCVVDADGGDGLLRALAAAAPRLGGEAFAERYIEGREFNIALIDAPDGPRVLPPAEIEFRDFPPGRPRVVDWRAKWDEESFEYRSTPRRQDFEEEDADLLRRLAALAMDCWRVFGLGGCARVDFRVDGHGHPWILEVNANPCLSPDAGFAAALERAGIPYARAIGWIVERAAAGPTTSREQTASAAPRSNDP